MSAGLTSEQDGLQPHAPGPEVLRIGLLGCGVVGSPIAQTLLEDRDDLERAAGVRLELARVAVRHPDKARSVDLPPAVVTTDALAVAIDPGIDILIEVIGGIEPAMDAIHAALADNKSVVTANKELLSGAGADLVDDPDTDLQFEASVCGAIPIVRTLRESCAGDRIESFTGILSGTCNFVLGKMAQSGCMLRQALAEAQRRGYAEADPTADIEGFDAAAKVAILARVAFGVPATIDDVTRQGISDIDGARVHAASSEGLVYKLVGSGRRSATGVDLRVGPQLVPSDHPLARINGEHNAVVVEAAKAGQLTLQGAGAGGDPTAAAVLGDLVAAARRRARSRKRVPVCI